MVENWQKIKEQPYHLNYRQAAKWTFRLPDGSVHNYDIVLNRHVAAAIALTPENRVILAAQYRPGPQQVLLELPAGVVDAGETPAQTMQRELLEETGYQGDMEYVGASYRDAYSTIMLHTFVVKNCRIVQEHTNEADEFIEVVLKSLAAFRDHLRSGQLTDIGPGYLALDYLGLL